jgi:hypothetical protein
MNQPGGIWPTVNNGVPAALYAFAYLYISAAGAGPLSVDALFRRRDEGEAEKTFIPRRTATDSDGYSDRIAS